MSIHFWESVCFISLLALLYKPAKSMITQSLDSYSKQIRLKIKEAEDLRISAEKTIKFYQEQNEKFATLSKEILDISNHNILKLTDDHKKFLAHKISTKKILHSDKLTIYNREEMSKIKATLVSKSIVIAQMYLRDNSSKTLTKPQVSEALYVIKHKKPQIH